MRERLFFNLNLHHPFYPCRPEEGGLCWESHRAPSLSKNSAATLGEHCVLF